MGETLEAVAGRIPNMDAKYLGEIERGWHAPTIVTAKRIAVALELPLADLVRDLWLWKRCGSAGVVPPRRRGSADVSAASVRVPRSHSSLGGLPGAYPAESHQCGHTP